MDRRAWVLTVLAAIVAVALGVWLASVRNSEGPRPAVDPEGGAVPAGGGSPSQRPPTAGGEEPGSGSTSLPLPPPESGPRAITGVVIDSFAKSGIEGATVEFSDQPTSPFPAADDEGAMPPPGPPPGTRTVSTAKDGTFRYESPSVPAEATVRSPGYGRVRVGGLEPGRHLEIELARGGSIRGHATDPAGKPVPGASVRARGEDKATPEAWAAADAEGAFEVGDLVSGRYAVTVRAPARMNAGVMVDVPGGGDVRVVLAPALVAWLAFKGQGDALPARAKVSATADGTEFTSKVIDPSATHPTTVEGKPPAAGPLRVPASARQVVVTVSAAGFRPWESGTLSISDGGEDVVLEPALPRDAAFGGIRLELSDAGSGASLHASTAVVRWMRADGGTLPPDVSVAADERLRIEGLPPGAYRLAIAYPGREPTEATATVSGGAVADARAAMTEGARLLVRVKSPQGRPVRARLTQGGQPIVVWPEDPAARRPAGEAPESGIFFADAKGVVLTGVGSGPYLVEVVDPRWSAQSTEASPSRIRLREVELLATPR